MREPIVLSGGPVGERDGGFTLVEMLVAMSLFAGVMAMVFTILITMSWQSKDNLARDDSVAQARLALMQIDRQVRSGNVISDPASETTGNSGADPYYSLRVYTQTDGVFQCVQWRITFPTGPYGVLEYRSWQKEVGGVVTDWRVVARNVVKPNVTPPAAGDPSTWPPFYVDSTVGFGSIAQTIRVTVRIKDPGARASSKPITVTSVLTGRNTVFGYDADECALVPTP